MIENKTSANSLNSGFKRLGLMITIILIGTLQANAQWTLDGTTNTANKQDVKIIKDNTTPGNLLFKMLNGDGEFSQYIQWDEAGTARTLNWLRLEYTGSNSRITGGGENRDKFKIKSNDAGDIMTIDANSGRVTFHYDVNIEGATGSSLWTPSGNNISYSLGNVGIGIANPSEKLDVNGNVKATAFSGSGAQLTGITFNQISGLGTAAALNTGTNANNVVKLDASGKLPAIDGSQLTNLPTSAGFWSEFGGYVYYNGGNVGIGTVLASEKLEVIGNVKADSIIGDGSQITGIDASQILNLDNGGSSLWDENAGKISYSTGNVGIGTTNPTEKLEVKGNVSANNLTLSRTGSGNIATFLNLVSQNAGRSHLQFKSYNPTTDVLSNSFSIVNQATVSLEISHPNHGTLTRFSNDGNISFSPKEALLVNGNLGVGVSNAQSSLHTGGTIIAGGRSTSIFNNTSTTALNGNEGIILPGPTSQYLISAQDGNGRVQHKWNATNGTNEKFLVANEDAFFLDYNAQVNGSSPWLEFKHADGAGKAAGDAIAWKTHFSLDQSGNAVIGGNLNVNGTIDATNVLVNGLPISANSSLTLIDAGERDISVERPSTRKYRPGLSAADRGVAFRVLANPASGQPIYQVRSSGQATRFFVEHDGYTGGENSAYFSGNNSRPHLFGYSMLVGSTNAADLVSGSKLTVKGNLNATTITGAGDNITVGGELLSNLLDGSGGSSLWEDDGNDNIFYNAGNVSIGLAGQNRQLTMNGDIVANRMAIAANPNNFTAWPDYVFSKEYELMSIEKLNDFIKKEKHLPEVPSASQIATEGFDLEKMHAVTLKKVEELTLYIIEQNKQLSKQNERIEQLESKMATQK